MPSVGVNEYLYELLGRQTLVDLLPKRRIAPESVGGINHIEFLLELDVHFAGQTGLREQIRIALEELPVRGIAPLHNTHFAVGADGAQIERIRPNLLDIAQE